MSRTLARALGAALALTFAWSAAPASAAGGPGAVYTLTNAVAGNAVAVFDRAADGTLTPAGTVPTGGTGTGAGLGNQGALALTPEGHRLYAVNAGSNSVTAFAVGTGGLAHLGTVPSGGVRPISVTVHGDLVYVLNAGDGVAAGSISGFTASGQGALTPLAGSTRPLSTAAAGPAQIGFSPDGRTLVVTEKATNSVVTYTVGAGGLASGPDVHASSGATPFGFAFDNRGTLIVSEAFGGAASALSSYDVDPFATISASVAAPGQRAACWVVTARNGRYAYTTNTGTGTVSSYAIGEGGSLTLWSAVAGTTGGAPIDAAVSGNGRFLYVLNATTNRIDAFAVGRTGSLSPLAGGVGGLPAGTNGLAAR